MPRATITAGPRVPIYELLRGHLTSFAPEGS
jgi:hypothetical protein